MAEKCQRNMKVLTSDSNPGLSGGPHGTVASRKDFLAGLALLWMTMTLYHQAYCQAQEGAWWSETALAALLQSPTTDLVVPF